MTKDTTTTIKSQIGPRLLCARHRRPRPPLTHGIARVEGKQPVAPQILLCHALPLLLGDPVHKRPRQARDITLRQGQECVRGCQARGGHSAQAEVHGQLRGGVRDYDGTLAPMVADPAAARLPKGVRKLLRRLGLGLSARPWLTLTLTLTLT